MDFDWKSIVKTVAPTLATALGGPLAGMATSAISQAVLGRPDGKEEEIAKYLERPTPETMLALKKAEQDFKVRMKELDVDIARIHKEDRADARQRDIQSGDKMNSRLANQNTLLLLVALAAILFTDIPPEMANLLSAVVGMLITQRLKIGDYYYGTSKSSADKTVMLANAKQN